MDNLYVECFFTKVFENTNKKDIIEAFKKSEYSERKKDLSRDMIIIHYMDNKIKINNLNIKKEDYRSFNIYFYLYQNEGESDTLINTTVGFDRKNNLDSYLLEPVEVESFLNSIVKRIKK